MCCWRAATCARCASRNDCQPGGPSHLSLLASRGETPCRAATARASCHSKADQPGAVSVGEASSPASLSVILRRAPCSTLGGGTLISLLCIPFIRWCFTLPRPPHRPQTDPCPANDAGSRGSASRANG